MPQPLTVIIPCKNEASNIEACIASVRSIADEILIADSGSTDETLAIVGRLGGCRIVQRDFVNSGDFKNWAIPQATHQWVFIIDADERATAELARDINRVLTTGPDFDGYWVHRMNHFMGHRLRHTSWARDRVIRLFHRDRGRYKLHTDHSEVELPRNGVGNLSGMLIHHTILDYSAYLAKMIKYAGQQAELWHGLGRRPSLIRLVANGPLRFLRCFVLHRGFLDGRVGFQVAAITGFYSFLKQAMLWQKSSAITPSHLDNSHTW